MELQETLEGNLATFWGANIDLYSLVEMSWEINPNWPLDRGDKFILLHMRYKNIPTLVTKHFFFSKNTWLDNPPKSGQNELSNFVDFQSLFYANIADRWTHNNGRVYTWEVIKEQTSSKTLRGLAVCQEFDRLFKQDVQYWLDWKAKWNQIKLEILANEE